MKTYKLQCHGLSEVIPSLRMPMVHVITANAKGHRIALFTAYGSAIAAAQTAVY